MIGNTCNFVGRISSDITTEVIGQGQNAFTKAKFSIAIKRKLSKNEQQQKAQGTQVKEAYFLNMEAIGATADFIVKYFAKGKPIALTAYYEEFSWTDKQTNAKKYGHRFNVEEVMFVPQDSSQNGGNGGNNNAGGNQQNNYQQNQQVNNNVNNGQYQASMEDIPF